MFASWSYSGIKSLTSGVWVEHYINLHILGMTRKNSFVFLLAQFILYSLSFPHLNSTYLSLMPISITKDHVRQDSAKVWIGPHNHPHT